MCVQCPHKSLRGFQRFFSFPPAVTSPGGTGLSFQCSTKVAEVGTTAMLTLLSSGRQRTRGKYDLRFLEARQDKTEPTHSVGILYNAGYR